jgi:hypothetical protein
VGAVVVKTARPALDVALRGSAGDPVTTGEGVAVVAGAASPALVVELLGDADDSATTGEAAAVSVEAARPARDGALRGDVDDPTTTGEADAAIGVAARPALAVVLLGGMDDSATTGTVGEVRGVDGPGDVASRDRGRPALLDGIWALRGVGGLVVGAPCGRGTPVLFQAVDRPVQPGCARVTQAAFIAAQSDAIEVRPPWLRDADAPVEVDEGGAATTGMAWSGLPVALLGGIISPKGQTQGLDDYGRWGSALVRLDGRHNLASKFRYLPLLASGRARWRARGSAR